MNGMRLVALVAALAVLAPACGGVTHEQVGASLGAALGAAGGVFGARALGGGRTGQIVGGVTGAVIGGVVGYQIARVLDEKDRPRHAAATERALETGQGQSWANPETGTSGRVEVVRESAGSPAAPRANTQVTRAPARSPDAASPAASVPVPATPASVTTPAEVPAAAPSQEAVASVRPCKTLRQTIQLKDGTTREEEVTACKGPNGWEPVG